MNLEVFSAFILSFVLGWLAHMGTTVQWDASKRLKALDNPGQEIFCHQFGDCILAPIDFANSVGKNAREALIRSETGRGCS